MTDYKKILVNCLNLSFDEKSYLEKLMIELERHQKKIYKDLEKHVDEIKDNYRVEDIPWKVRTALVDRDKASAMATNTYAPIIDVMSFKEYVKAGEIKWGEENKEDNKPVPRNPRLKPIPREKKGWTYMGMGFLDCNLHQIDKYIDSKYKGVIDDGEKKYVFDYKIESWNGFIEYGERLIEITAEEIEYGINKPYILSPWSRRAVVVKADFETAGISLEILSKNAVISFDLAKNKLEGILLCNKLLIWNVLIKEKLPKNECVEEGIMPYFSEHVIKVFSYTAENGEYIFLSPELYKKAEIRRFNNEIYVGIHESDILDRLYYSKVVLVEGNWPKDVAEKVFDNCLTDGVNITRVRTEYDVAEVVNTYLPKGIEFAGCSLYKEKFDNAEDVTTYSTVQQYKYSNSEVLLSSAPCYLKFIDTAKDSFFFDRVIFLISFMRHAYPEYEWKGIY